MTCLLWVTGGDHTTCVLSLKGQSRRLFMKPLLTAVCYVCFCPCSNQSRHFIVRLLWIDILSFSPVHVQSWFCCSTLFLPPPALLCGFLPVISLSCHAHLLHQALSNNLPLWPAGTLQREASPSGSAALAARSKGCSRAQPWKEPCCLPTGR